MTEKDGALIWAQRLAQPLRILSTAKSFDDNWVLGSKRLNRWGLHRWRVKWAARLAVWRRARLACAVPPERIREFERNGFVVIKNALPDAEFAALRRGLAAQSWPSRDMVQGDTVTRRVAVNGELRQAVPPLARLLDADWFKALTRYVASFDIEPLYYVQSIIKRGGGPPDPQVHLHSDAFHPSMKAWLFLDEVKPGEGAFTYVPGSHRLTPERLAWEHQVAQNLPDGGDRLTRRGSFRIERDQLAALGLSDPIELSCPANTLVVADTYGFHARGPSGADLHRVEIWAYSRRNPFYPWLGGDVFSLPGIAERRMDWLWRLRDRFPRLFKQPWKPVGEQVLGLRD